MQKNECPCGQTALNDQDRLEDLLSQEKYLISAYGTFIPEASCPQLRQVLAVGIDAVYHVVARRELHEELRCHFLTLAKVVWLEAKHCEILCMRVISRLL